MCIRNGCAVVSVGPMEEVRSWKTKNKILTAMESFVKLQAARGRHLRSALSPNSVSVYTIQSPTAVTTEQERPSSPKQGEGLLSIDQVPLRL